jgi:hypothetical protein
LRALALVRRRQRGDTANARIEALGDALDGTTLAGRVASLEQHDNLLFLVLDPVLEFDEFALQAKRFPEVNLAVERGPPGTVRRVSDERLKPIVIDFQFQFFVEAVCHLLMHSRAQRGFIGRDGIAHAKISSQDWSCVTDAEAGPLQGSYYIDVTWRP